MAEIAEALRAQVRAEIAAHGLSQRELAERAGLSEDVLNRRLRTKRAAGLSIAEGESIAAAFGLTLEDLLERARARIGTAA